MDMFIHICTLTMHSQANQKHIETRSVQDKNEGVLAKHKPFILEEQFAEYIEEIFDGTTGLN